MVSSAGRGRPRPLLAGVFRKACDYCVRSKRGCNGGTPCEQCVRRDQPCTYSQRRKSGPRGRPVRQTAHPTCNAAPAGTRTSARRGRMGSAFGPARNKSPAPTAGPPLLSPTRTASISSSSSDYSPSEESCESDSEDSVNQRRQLPENRNPMRAAKKGKISAFCDTKSLHPVSPSSPFKQEPVSSPSRLTIGLPQPREGRQAKGHDAALSASAADAQRWRVSPQPLQLLQLAPGASWTEQPVEAECSTGLAQQQDQGEQQQEEEERRVRESIETTPAMASPIHEISMQPWELSFTRAARPVVSEAGSARESDEAENPFALQAQPSDRSTSSSSQETGSTNDIKGLALTTGTTSATVSPFGGPFLAQCELQEELQGLDLDMGPEWDFEFPSLTREMSLVRAVESLGQEQTPHGFDGEGTFTTGW